MADNDMSLRILSLAIMIQLHALRDSVRNRALHKSERWWETKWFAFEIAFEQRKAGRDLDGGRVIPVEHAFGGVVPCIRE